MTEFPTRTKPWGALQKSIGSAVKTEKDSLVRYVEFNLTGRCEGGCITCLTNSVYQGEKSNKSVEDLKGESEKFKGIFRRLKELGLEFLTLYGREPSLWDREASEKLGEANYFLRDLVSWCSQDLGIRVCLAASGMNLEEPLLRTLFDNKGVLFMKNWGSKDSVETLMRGKNSYERIQNSWELVKRVRKDYDKTTVLAEFLYTGINRKDLLRFWEKSINEKILPFVEVPVIKGACAKNYQKLKIDPEEYVKDIYDLSILNLSLLHGLSLDEARNSDIWHPPYGSVFPLPCDKLTKADSLFVERNGDMSICCGVPVFIGNVEDENIEAKLRESRVLRKVRNAYQNLEGACGNCDYSSRLEVCYGCRGNGFSYETDTQGVLGEDPLCFGIAAKRLGEEKLRKFMSVKHIARIMDYFGGKHG